MAISLKDRAELAASLGLQAHEVDIRENPDGSVDVNPARKPATESTGAGTFLRYGAANAPGAAVGTTAGVAAMETAAPLVNRGADMLRGIPKIGSIAAPVAKFLGNAATFGTGAAGGKYLAEEKMGLGGVKDLIIGGEKQEALDAAQHPWMMRAGEFAANFAGQKLPDVKSLATGVPKVATLRRLATDDLGLSTAESAAIQNLGGGAVLSAGQEGLREYQAGEELSPGAIAVAGVAGGLFGDARAPFQKAGSGIAAGLRSMAGGKPVVAPAPRRTESEILAEFQGKQPETATTAEAAPVPPQETTAEMVDPLAKAMAQGREATAKLREVEGIPMPYADRLKATQSELMRNVMLSRPRPEPAPLTTADVMPEAPLTGPSTRDLVQKFLPNQPTGYTQRPAREGEGAGVPRQRDYEFGRGPEDPVQQEFDRIQNELEGRRVRYQEDTEAEANAVGKAIEGLALNANPVMAPAALARGNTTAEPSGFDQFKTRMRAQELAPGVGALERRGFQYKAAEEPIVTPEGRRARGAFTPSTGEIAIDPTVANETTAKHEGMHAELQDMLLSGNPKLERLATEMVAIAGEEPLAEGGAVASNAAEKTNRLVRLLQDNWNWLRTTKLGGGDQSPERLARVLAERFDFQAPGPVKTGAAEGVKLQPTEEAAQQPTDDSKFQEMIGPDEFNTVPSSVLDVPDNVVAKAGYDFMADKARIYGATVNTALTDAKKLGGEDMWRRVMEKRSAAFDSGAQPNYTPDELPMAQRVQNMYDEFAVLRNNYGLPGNNAANYTGHLADINVIKKAEADYPAFAAEYLPAYLNYNATQYGPAQKGGFDPVEAAQTFRDYFTGAARAPHSEFGADFGVLTKSARQYGLPPEMRAPYDFRHAMRFGERFTRGLAEKRHLKDNPHVAQMLGLNEGGAPAGEIYRDFRSALAGQLPNQGKTKAFSDIGELYDAARQTVNTAIMQAPTGLWNTLSKLKDYGVVIAQNPSTGVPALMKASQNLLTDFSNLRREAISVDAIRPGQDYIGANENLNVAGNTARTMRNFNSKARMVTGTEAIEQFNRVQDYAFGKSLAEAALAGRRAQDPAAEDFWKRFGAGIDDTMPDDEIIKRAAGNFVRDIQGSYGPEGLPAWLLNSGAPSLLMRLNRFGWENMRRVQRNVVEPARQGNWAPLLTYIGLAGVTAEVRKQIADALLKQPSGLPTAQEIEAAGAEPAVEQMLNLMEMADAAGAFGFAGSAMGAAAKNARGTKRAVVMDPTISFGWQLSQNLAAAVDALKEGEPAAPVIQEVLKRTLLDNIQNLRPLAADRGEAQDRRNKKVFSDLTDRKKVTTGAMLEGLALGSLTQPGRKIDPTAEAAKTGDQTALRALSPEERRRADNYPGGYEDTKTEAAYRRFIESGQGEESLEDYLARRQEYKQRVRRP